MSSQENNLIKADDAMLVTPIPVFPAETRQCQQLRLRTPMTAQRLASLAEELDPMAVCSWGFWGERLLMDECRMLVPEPVQDGDVLALAAVLYRFHSSMVLFPAIGQAIMRYGKKLTEA